MRKTLLIAALVMLACAVAMNASALPRHKAARQLLPHEAVKVDGRGAPYGLSADCTLQGYNWCSGYLWQFGEVPGAVWGSVFDSHECPGGCTNGGTAADIVLYTCCSTGAPGHLGDLAIVSVDAEHCPTWMLCDLGPQTLTHCVSGDRWTDIPIRYWCHLGGNPFAIQVTWGADPTNPIPTTSNGLANFYCSMGITSTFPGCYNTTYTCSGYNLAVDPQRTFIYWTDWNGDGTLDNLCAMYGQPASLAFPYVYGYGYMTNNLPMVVGLDCSSTSAVENTSWGHVKALYK